MDERAVKRVRYRPAVRKRGEIETFAQSLLTFTAEAESNVEAARLEREWERRCSGPLEAVLLLEAEEVTACRDPSTTKS